MRWQCKIAPSLGEGFSGTPQTCWGTDYYDEKYIDESGSYLDIPTVFFGLYGLPDFYSLWRHRGRKCILWAGSDIQHFLKGYWLDEEGKMPLNPFSLAPWIDTYCESYVENEVEQQALRSVGIRSRVVPSFLGDIGQYKIEYKWSDKPKVYTSVSGNDFKVYGWDKIPKLARENPDIEFHLYGQTGPIEGHDWEWPDNVVVHGRVPQGLMDYETKKMQGALRLTEFDGFSEIVAKAMLWGQQVFSIIHYPYCRHPDQLNELIDIKIPNIAAREWLLLVVNKYPWNTK